MKDMESGEAQEMNAPSLGRERGSSDCGQCFLLKKFVSYAVYIFIILVQREVRILQASIAKRRPLPRSLLPAAPWGVECLMDVRLEFGYYFNKTYGLQESPGGLPLLTEN
jgi:hypothetical protein